MAFEVACSQCEGRLMVEEAGVIVACPHCGAHLNIEAPSEPGVSEQSEDVDPVVEDPGTESEADTDGQFDVATSGSEPADLVGEIEAEPAATLASSPSVTPDIPLPTEAAEPDNPTAESQGEQMPIFGEPPADLTTDDAHVNAAQIIPTVSDAVHSAPETSAETSTSQQPSEDTSPPPSTPEVPPSTAPMPLEGGSVSSVSAGRGVSRQTFTLVRNYAIAMTLAVVFLIYKLLNPNMSNLESLPDLKPLKNKDGTIGYSRVPEAAEMPPGHLLSLGETQRFGNLNVTPVRVTKEPIEFVHHLGDTGVNREPGDDVVKLWFEFENLSSDQHIAPLDGLVFKRDERDWENIRSNNFVCRQSQKNEDGKLVFVYELNEKDIWVLRNQNAELEIAPGEKIETFIPTSEEGVADLLNSDEPLVWRVHFRKGYSPKNYGLTTVIEVAFDSSDIGTASSTPEIAEPTPEQEADSAA
jgi:hypothetical protein